MPVIEIGIGMVFGWVARMLYEGAWVSLKDAVLPKRPRGVRG